MVEPMDKVLDTVSLKRIKYLLTSADRDNQEKGFQASTIFALERLDSIEISLRTIAEQMTNVPEVA